MKVLVTGATGLLGQALVEAAPAGISIIPAARTVPQGQGAVTLDLARVEEVETIVANVRADWVVHAGAMTNVDECERNPQAALHLNAVASGAVARGAAKAGAGLVFVSTDYVYDGTRGQYVEEDAPNPISWYGKSKLAGEYFCAAARIPLIVARTAVLFGPHRKNFVTWVREELGAGRPVRAANDQWVTPTYTYDLASQIFALIRSGEPGIYHTAGADGMSRLEMAKAVAASFRLREDIIQPVSFDDLALFAKRPRDSRMNTTKISSVARPWSFQRALQDLAGREKK